MVDFNSPRRRLKFVRRGTAAFWASATVGECSHAVTRRRRPVAVGPPCPGVPIAVRPTAAAADVHPAGESRVEHCVLEALVGFQRIWDGFLVQSINI